MVQKTTRKIKTSTSSVKPAPGTSREQGTTPEQKEPKKNHKAFKLIIFFAAIILIILAILWLLRGKTTTTGKYPENVKDESLVCESTELIYPKLGSFNEPESTSLIITALFQGADSLSSLSIKNLMTFSSNHDAVIAEAKSHANFNFGLQAINYDPGKFDNKFSIIDDKLLVNLTGKLNDINEYDKSYFMIESDKIPKTITEYKTMYESSGFICESTFDEK